MKVILRYNEKTSTEYSGVVHYCWIYNWPGDVNMLAYGLFTALYGMFLQSRVMFYIALSETSSEYLSSSEDPIQILAINPFKLSSYKTSYKQFIRAVVPILY